MTVAHSEELEPGEDLEVIPLSEVDEESVLALLRTSLSSEGVTAKTESYWRWKHRDNVFGESVGCAAKHRMDGTIVAVRPLMRWVFVAPGHLEVAALRPVDTVTHPSWRGRGLFSRLTKLAISQFDGRSATLVFNTPNANSLPGYEKMGWRRADSLSLLVRPAGFARLLRAFSAGIQRGPKVVGWRGVVRSDVLLAGEMSEQLVEEVVGFCVRAEAARIPRGLRTKRTKEFMIWRYFKQPNVEYGFSLVRNSACEIESVVIVRTETRKWATAILVVDVFTMPGSIDAVRLALRSIRRRVKADLFVAHAAKASYEWSALRQERFLPVKSKVLAARVVGAAVNPSPLGKLLQIPVWDLTFADIEIF